MSRTFVIGDVHGCARELDRLLDRCELGRGDRVVLVGDLVNKGPDSLTVIRRCLEIWATTTTCCCAASRHDGATTTTTSPSPFASSRAS
jgi:hypothetical protein